MIYIPSIKFQDDTLFILDQTLLPLEKKYIQVTSIDEACEAIINLRVRGAPAIGVMAALSLYTIQKDLVEKKVIADREAFFSYLKNNIEKLSKTRPTAVNLFHALQRIEKEMQSSFEDSLEELLGKLKKIALEIYEEDKRLCDAIGYWGSSIIFDGAKILTHCNTGSLATAGRGTALGAIYSAVEQGKKVFVYNTETRPLLQGARLTSFELQHAGIPAKLLTDNMVASLMQDGQIDMVFVGADRIAKNGDTANKIGTLGIAILSNYFGIPFYVLAPYTTIDTQIKNGKEIKIEHRNPDEVRKFRDCESSPRDVDVYNPAFDVTPSRLITGIITEKGIFRYPYDF